MEIRTAGMVLHLPMHHGTVLCTGTVAGRLSFCHQEPDLECDPGSGYGQLLHPFRQ